MLKEISRNLINNKIIIKKLIGDIKNVGDLYFVEINPSCIKHICIFSESSPALIGENAFSGLHSGYFDLFKKDFTKHFMHRTVLALANGEDWETTEFFNKIKKTESQVFIERKKAKLLRMLDTFSKYGYLSQYQLGNMQYSASVGGVRIPRNETIIGIDRYGSYYRIVGGRHRLAVAQVLGLDRMYAIVSLIHKDALGMLPERHRLIRSYPEDFRPF